MLGREWFFQLKFDWPEIKALQVQSKDFEVIVTELVEQYKNVFTDEIGHLKNFKAEIFVRPDAMPIFCKVRSIPYSLTDRINAEIGRLESLELFQRLNFPNGLHQLFP